MEELAITQYPVFDGQENLMPNDHTPAEQKDDF